MGTEGSSTVLNPPVFSLCWQCEVGIHGLLAMTDECALLDYLGRRISALIAGEEAAGCERNRKEQIGGDEHRPKACAALRPGSLAVGACQAPASEPANDGQNRGRRETYEDLQRQGQVAEGHSRSYFALWRIDIAWKRETMG
jgi:hypothetical protein